MDNIKRLDTSMKSIETAGLLAASLQKEAAHSKATFSPAMDESPALKGGQAKLPDKIQAAILKKKLKGKLRKLASLPPTNRMATTPSMGPGRPRFGQPVARGMAARGPESFKPPKPIRQQFQNRKAVGNVLDSSSSVANPVQQKNNPQQVPTPSRGANPFRPTSTTSAPWYKPPMLGGKRKTGSANYVHSGLSQASAVLYESTYGTRMEKQAFRNPFSLMGGVGRTAAGAGGAGAAGLGLNRIRQLRLLASKSPEGLAARKAMASKHVANRHAKAQALKEGKTHTPGAFDRSAQEVEFLQKMKGLKGSKFADNPMGFLKAYGPEVAKAALEGGGAAAIAGGVGRFASNWARRKKMMDTAKAVAVPAALGLGGYALLKD